MKDGAQEENRLLAIRRVEAAVERNGKRDKELDVMKATLAKSEAACAEYREALEKYASDETWWIGEHSGLGAVKGQLLARRALAANPAGAATAEIVKAAKRQEREKPVYSPQPISGQTMSETVAYHEMRYREACSATDEAVRSKRGE